MSFKFRHLWSYKSYKTGLILVIISLNVMWKVVRSCVMYVLSNQFLYPFCYKKCHLITFSVTSLFPCVYRIIKVDLYINRVIVRFDESIYLFRGRGFETASEELWKGQRNEFGSQQWAHACTPGFQHTSAETLRGMLSKRLTDLICGLCEFYFR